MKKIYTLILMSVLAILTLNAQDHLFFSEYIEGSSNNKALEIHNPNDAAVDLANYRIAQTNNGSDWIYFHEFPAGASIEAGDNWVIITNQVWDDLFHAAAADEVLAYSSDSPVHFNGNDARAIAYINPGVDTTLLDVIGVAGEDKKWDVAGITEATADHTLIRKNEIVMGNTDWTASAGADSASSEWIVFDQNFFDSLQVRNYVMVASIILSGEGDATTIDTDKGSLQILAEVLPADATTNAIEWSVSDKTLAIITQDGLFSAINDGTVTITATALDGSGVLGTIDITNTNQTLVVPISSVTISGEGDATSVEVTGTLQINAVVLPADPTNDTLTWSVSDTAVASIDSTGLVTPKTTGLITVTAMANDGFGAAASMELVVYTDVADLTAVRKLDMNDDSTVYRIVGEVIISNQQSYRNKKYVQDADAGILIDDSPGVIETSYDVEDGITGLMGTIEAYKSGMLQFHPLADPGAASSTGNTLIPIEVTPAELIAKMDTLESRLVIVKNVNFVDADGTLVFDDGKNYDITDGMDTVTYRTDVYGSSLKGSVIPDSANLTGVVLENYGAVQVFPRSADDVEELIAYVVSSDASISDLLVDGVSIPDFSPAQLTYNVVLPTTTTDVPPVTAVANHDSAVVSVTDAANLTGTEAERTSTVLITAEDKVTTKSYLVIFSLAVGIADMEGESIEIYPVPANDFLHVKGATSLRELRMINMTGSTVMVINLSGEKSTRLDISDLESGVYFLKLSGDNSTSILRFVKN